LLRGALRYPRDGISPKPEPSAYRGFVSTFDVDPARAVFFEDSARNLTPAKAMGMQTVWLDFGTDWGARAMVEGAIDETIDDLAAWLDALAARPPRLVAQTIHSCLIQHITRRNTHDRTA
jgi:beta-phosphoglucomutase-like phosphatase (HAD superfamily)